MLWVLHLHHSPGVQAAPHLLPLGLNLLVGAHHRKRDASLGKSAHSYQGIWRLKNTLPNAFVYDTLLEIIAETPVYLEDPGLLFKVFILIRLGVGQVVNLDTVFINFIEDLSKVMHKR